MLSAFEDPTKRKQCLDLGAHAYLVKPFEPQLLMDTVSSALISSKEKIHA
jgi:two-component system, chemotaxis family, chemotaxis protein CheY